MPEQFLDQPQTLEQIQPPEASMIYEYFWPQVNSTIVWIALFIGIVLYIIGYFAGGKLSKGKIFMCIGLTSIIGFLARPILNPIMRFMVLDLSFTPHTAYILTSTVWMVFIVGVAVMMYETFTTTAAEAHSHPN